jgi:16S rRNA (adenine1518-N6/adenine1519-N6)-dimethyltransferase
VLLEETRLLLKRYGLTPKGRLGQHFLIDEGFLARQVKAAALSSRDTVLEVGPGIGTLTRHLLERAGRVVAVERDRGMMGILRDRFKERENLILLEGDVLKLDLPPFNKVVSNIPYTISSPLTFRLLEGGFDLALLTYQKEFAERLIARPGTPAYSRISVALYYRGVAEILEILPPRSFYPPPKVESALVRIVPREPPFSVDEAFFFRVVGGIFLHRGKTLRKALFHSLERILGREVEKGERLRLIHGALPRDLLERRVFQLTPEEIAGISEGLEAVRC